MSVTRQAFDAAVRAAAAKGTPQPVMDSSGHIAYFVNQSGQTVDAPIAGSDRYSQTPGKATNPSAYSQDASGNLKSVTAAQAAWPQADAAKAAAVKTAAGQQSAAVAVANQGIVWIDGHRVKVVGVNPDGSLSYTQDGANDPTTKKPYSYTQPTAFDALNGSAVPSGDSQFLFAHNSVRIDPNTGLPAGNASAAGAPADRGENRFTIQQGLQWLANLSVQHLDLYNAFVGRLHDAHYLSDSQYQDAVGGWNNITASAMATAAQDVAVANGAKGGETLTLDELLTQRAAAAKAAKTSNAASAYVPVPRNYADPADLEASARSQAQADLGRDLHPDEVTALVSHFHGLQDQMYNSIDAAGRQNQNARVTVPSVAGQTDQFVHDGAHAQEAANFRAAKYGSMMRSLFGLGG